MQLCAPPMFEAAIFADGVNQTAALSRHERLDLNGWFFVPAKRSGGLGLILIIDGNGVVGAGAAKAIAFDGISNIGESAGIDKDGLSAMPGYEAKSIGVTVAGGSPAEGSSVELYI